MAKKTVKKAPEPSGNPVVNGIKKFFGFFVGIFRSIMHFFWKIKVAIYIFIALIVLTVAGFAAGMKFGYLTEEQVDMVNDTLGLYRLPVVGENFKTPEGYQRATVGEIISQTGDMIEQADVAGTLNRAADSVRGIAQDMGLTKPPKKEPEIKLTKKDIEERIKEREDAEKKRIQKIARVYNNMKPQNAADAMSSLPDDTAVAILQRMDDDVAAQTLSRMDPAQAARLTQIMFDGNRTTVILPTEIARDLRREAAEEAQAMKEIEGNQEEE